jgi:uncharacterized membrane protein YdjX (TVP38/TMEM64 family)
LKKANKKAATKNTKGVQKTMKKASARSSRVTTKKIEQAHISQVVQPEIHNKPGSSKLLTNILRILALFAVVAITIYIYSIRERVEQFEAWGYPGIFLIALLANATILLPAPGLALIYATGGILNPLGIGLAAATGGTIGELSGYLAGFSGQAVIERMDIYNRIKPWVDKYGGWAILVLSAIPNPFFDVAGIAAGIARMPMRTFLVFTWAGQFIKMTAVALMGHYSITLVTDFIK